MNNPKAKDNLKPFVKGEDPRRNLKGRPVIPDLKEAAAVTLNEGGNMVEEILRKQILKANNGDTKSAELVLSWIFSKPKQVIEADVTFDIPIFPDVKK